MDEDRNRGTRNTVLVLLAVLIMVMILVVCLMISQDEPEDAGAPAVPDAPMFSEVKATLFLEPRTQQADKGGNLSPIDKVLEKWDDSLVTLAILNELRETLVLLDGKDAEISLLRSQVEDLSGSNDALMEIIDACMSFMQGLSAMGGF